MLILYAQLNNARKCLKIEKSNMAATAELKCIYVPISLTKSNFCLYMISNHSDEMCSVLQGFIYGESNAIFIFELKCEEIT